MKHPPVRRFREVAYLLRSTGLPDAELPDLLSLHIQHAEGDDSVVIAPKAAKGSWVKAGSYTFDKQGAITVDGGQTKGPVFADAVLLIPEEHQK